MQCLDNDGDVCFKNVRHELKKDTEKHERKELAVKNMACGCRGQNLTDRHLRPK